MKNRLVCGGLIIEFTIYKIFENILETKGIRKLFRYFRVRVIKKIKQNKTKAVYVLYFHVSIAGESHLRKIAPLISVGTIRSATGEILYHAKRSYFLALLLRRSRAHVVFLSEDEKDAALLFMQIPLRCALSFPLASGRSVVRARSREFARNVAENASSRVLSRDCKLHLRLGDDRSPGDARASGVRLSGIPGGAWGYGSDDGGGSGGGPSRRIYTGYSPGQWSFRKPLIGPAARIVHE